MEIQILLILLPLVVTGLGFLTYNHPVFARWLNVVLIVMVLLANTIVQAIFGLKHKERLEIETLISQPVYRDIKIEDFARTPLDTLKIIDPILKGGDTTRFKLPPEVYELEQKLTAFHYGFGATKVQIIIFKALVEKDKEQYKKSHTIEVVLMWCVCGLGVFLIFSFAFDYLRNPPRKKKNNSPRQDPH